MSIEQSLERIANALESLTKNQPTNTVPVLEAPTPIQEPKKQGRPSKTPTAPDPIVTPVYTQQQVFETLRKHAEKMLADKTKALMVKYGAKTPKMAEIPVENYAALMAELENDLSGAIS